MGSRVVYYLSFGIISMRRLEITDKSMTRFMITIEEELSWLNLH